MQTSPNWYRPKTLPSSACFFLMSLNRVRISLQMGNRCAFVRLGPSGGLRLSSTHTSSSSIEQDQGVRLQDSAHSSLVAQEPMVQRSAQSSGRPPKKSTTKTRSAISKRSSSHRPKHVYLHVWPLSSNLSERNAFRLKLPLSSYLREDFPTQQSTTLYGTFSQICVLENRLSTRSFS